ncbi:MAG: hypothetical protein MUC29_01075 [Pyrinomonadaceae bacterium]|jgi:hypothetical protein|nr:hypothetical protein [Pyrinomonadaceae bacterium]
MATLEKQFEWLKVVLDEKPNNFAEYFKDDLANYLEIDEIESNELKDLFGKQFDSFISCKSLEEIRIFVNKLTNHIVMKLETDEIIKNYFS